MKPAIKKLWLDALRSGEYEQCKGKLHDGEGFCCLGVLYDVAVDGWWTKNGEWVTDTGNGSSLSFSLLLKLRLLEEIQSAAIRTNDDGATFAEIADWLETVL